MYKTKIVEIDGSALMVLPKEALDELGLSIGDWIFLTESRDGFHFTPCDPDLEDQMKTAREFMRNRREALRKLADL